MVVGLPHVLPCPAPRVVYADGELPDGTQRRRRRRKPESTDGVDEVIHVPSKLGDIESSRIDRAKRECPVPKPGGVVGELLGFHKSTASESNPRPESQPNR